MHECEWPRLIGSVLKYKLCQNSDSEEAYAGNPQRPRSRTKIRTRNMSIVGNTCLRADYPKRTETKPIADKKLVPPPTFESVS
jgi:hypothetical protein